MPNGQGYAIPTLSHSALIVAPQFFFLPVLFYSPAGER